jgi:hypothetical protein
VRVLRVWLPRFWWLSLSLPLPLPLPPLLLLLPSLQSDGQRASTRQCVFIISSVDRAGAERLNYPAPLPGAAPSVADSSVSVLLYMPTHADAHAVGRCQLFYIPQTRVVNIPPTCSGAVDSDRQPYGRSD